MVLPERFNAMAFVLVFAFISTVKSTTSVSFRCSNDEDCSLNGICEVGAGQCKCVPEWTGLRCAILNVRPARPPPLSGYNEPGYSSWGGSIIEDPKNQSVYHMFVSRIAGKCGIGSWQQNSEIIHATSTDPEGPYKYRDTVLGHFSHGPTVRKYDDKPTFMMMNLGCGRPFMPFVHGCTNGSTPSSMLSSINGHIPHAANGSTRRDANEHSYTSLCNQFNVSVMMAPSLDGPWSPHGGLDQVFLDSGSTPFNNSWFRRDGKTFSNPSPLVLNGAVMCAYRANARTGDEHVSVAIAQTPLSPYVDSRLHPAIAHPGEDPFLWQDERGHFHMLMHNFYGAVGSHAFSRDGIHWTRSDEAPFTREVQFIDGTTLTMTSRERPHLLLSATGQPRLFVTGVKDGGNGDHTYTLVIRVNSGDLDEGGGSD